jgi:hypothetical protein
MVQRDLLKIPSGPKGLRVHTPKPPDTWPRIFSIRFVVPDDRSNSPALMNRGHVDDNVDGEPPGSLDLRILGSLPLRIRRSVALQATIPRVLRLLVSSVALYLV